MSTLFDLPFEEPEEPEAPAPADPPARRRIISVSELSARVRDLLEGAFVEVWVDGEISNCRPWHTGHLYFTLKDRRAQVRAVMFRSAVRYLRFQPADGLRVVVRGQVTVYPPKGDYQIVCEHMEPQGLGALQLAYEQLRERLEREGLFDPARKRALPALPKKIGVVTSLQGAAVRDILQIVGRRYANAHVIVRATAVQGPGAAGAISAAIRDIASVPGVDVVIVGRGGGSIEDLWAFNEEPVARAIAACPIPIISAVGHQTDTTIADFVADLRAPTPSAAAELVVRQKHEFTAGIDTLRARAAEAARRLVQRERGRVHALDGRPGFAGLPARLATRGRHAAELTHELRRTIRVRVGRADRGFQDLRRRLERGDLRHRLAVLRGRLLRSDERLGALARRVRERHEARLRTLAGRLETLSPLAVLGRGYAVCWNQPRTAVVRDAGSVEPRDTVHVTLDRGELTCEVVQRRVAGDRR